MPALATRFQELLLESVMEWLEKFEMHNGHLAGKVLTRAGTEYITDMGEFATRGVPLAMPYKKSDPINSDFSTWQAGPSDAYRKGIGLDTHSSSCEHTVFKVEHARKAYFIPALVVARALFPLVPVAFEYIFTPRNLEVLCTLLESNGYWSVALPDFSAKRQQTFRGSTSDAMTWTYLYPSARKTWASAYQNAVKGRIEITLPMARIRLLPAGIEKDGIVYVTHLNLCALLALEEPFEFAENAPSSFLWRPLATPFPGRLNKYPEQTDESARVDESILLSDDEWANVEPICAITKASGRPQRDSRREIANSCLKRLATNAPWTSSVYAPFGSKTAHTHWVKWRKSGQLTQFLSAMRVLRPDAAYLTPQSLKCGPGRRKHNTSMLGIA